VNTQEQLLSRYQATVTSWEPFILDSTLMGFAVAVTPEGSDNVNMATGKHLDAVFGHLVFVREGYLYNLVVAPGGFAGAASGDPDERVATNRRLEEELYRSITFP